MKLNVFRTLLACVLPTLVVLCMVLSPMQSIKAEDEIFGNDTIVTFGLYSAETGQVETSQPDYFFDHIKYGLAHSIYNYNYRIFKDNANFPSEVSIFYQRLVDAFPSDFFTRLSQYRWLLNVYKFYNNRYILCFNRVPETGLYPTFDRRFNMNEKYTNEFLPDNFSSSFWVHNKIGNNNVFYSYCPPYYIETNDTSIQSSSPGRWNTLNDVNNALQNANVRSFYILMDISVPAMTISNISVDRYNAYYSIETLKAFWVANETTQQEPICLMCDFPIFITSSNQISWYSNANTLCVFHLDTLANKGVLDRDFTLSPIIISGYEDIPQATPTPTRTPTPAPTWTPYPTATPFPPVNEIEGISQMMTLFTRKYEFNINGNVIGIRPLYLFVFTFLVGAIFKAIQGGERN